MYLILLHCPFIFTTVWTNPYSSWGTFALINCHVIWYFCFFSTAQLMTSQYQNSGEPWIPCVNNRLTLSGSISKPFLWFHTSYVPTLNDEPYGILGLHNLDEILISTDSLLHVLVWFRVAALKWLSHDRSKWWFESTTTCCKYHYYYFEQPMVCVGSCMKVQCRMNLWCSNEWFWTVMLASHYT